MYAALYLSYRRITLTEIVTHISFSYNSLMSIYEAEHNCVVVNVRYQTCQIRTYQLFPRF